ncbi:hypothetical protein SK128_015013 [Halocaridina rubra]|uniref:Uncharacterized protein n=1 Tax=Halocaridina rubra TaxID=373956 RepID=A0AAN8XR87_HALRR
MRTNRLCPTCGPTKARSPSGGWSIDNEPDCVKSGVVTVAQTVASVTQRRQVEGSRHVAEVLWERSG